MRNWAIEASILSREINLILSCSRQSRLLEEALETKLKVGKGIRADFADRIGNFGPQNFC